MTSEQRQKAMTWWNELSWTEKGNMMEGDFKHRHPQSLTGSEIEKLRLNYTQHPDITNSLNKQTDEDNNNRKWRNPT